MEYLWKLKISQTNALVQCFFGQVRAIFKVQFLPESVVLPNPILQ